jgi:hypothetical protein
MSSAFFCFPSTGIGAETDSTPVLAGVRIPYVSLRLLTNEEMNAVRAGAWVYSPRFLPVRYEAVGKIILWDEGVSTNGVGFFTNTINVKN